MEDGQRQEDDYVWRFSLEAPAGESDDPLADMIRSFMEGFLMIGSFTRNGKEVHVDGLRLSDRKGIIALTMKKGG